MDTKDYIESGILELYVAGALSSAEMREVEGMAINHPEVATELANITEAFNTFITAFEHHPRPALRKAIVTRIRESALAVSENNKLLKSERTVSSTTLAYKYLLAACLASLVISTFASFFFYSRWSESEDRNISLLTEKNSLSQNYTQVKSAFDKTYNDMTVMRDMNVKMFALKSMDSTKSFGALVYWNIRTGESYLDVQMLPVPDPGMQYQLWAMVSGQPFDAGMFDMSGDDGLHRMKTVFMADSWAVTLEPEGGSPAPTLSSMYLLSKG